MLPRADPWRRLALNQPIGSVAALRLNVMGQSNDIAERDEADIKRWGIAPSFTIGFGTPLQVTGSFFYQREDNLPDYGFPVMFGGQEPIPPVNRRNFYGLANNDYEKTDVYIGTIRADYKYSDDFRLRNETRYGWYGRQALPGVPQPPTVAPGQSLSTVNVTVTRPQRDSEETIVANNLDAVVKWSLLGFKSSLVTGFEISYQTFDITRWTQPQTVTPLLNPNPFRAVPNAQRVLAAKSTSDEFGAGVYAVNDLSITEWLRFLAGVRWDYWNASADIDFPLPVANLSNVTNAWNPRLGLVVEPTKSQMYYFTYGTSSNPSAEALSQTLNAANQNLDPENNQSFELGAKWTLFDKLGINAALFRIEKTNARTVDPVTGIVELDGKQRVDGFEISAPGGDPQGLAGLRRVHLPNPKIVEAIDVQNGVPIQGNVLPNVPQSSATAVDDVQLHLALAHPGRRGGRLCEQAVRERLQSRVVSQLPHRRSDRGRPADLQLRAAHEHPEHLQRALLPGPPSRPLHRRAPDGRSSSREPSRTDPMLLPIPKVLTEAQVARCRELMERATWVDGRITAGHQSAKAKDNLQIPEGSPEAREMGEMIGKALEQIPLFVSAALPTKIFPPLFNRYEPGMTFGAHVDNAIRQIPGTPFRVRTDLSATLFISRPEEYDGGELVVEDTYGTHSVKLPAGDMILYPATSLHRVNPVTRGVRLASFFWIESMVRDDGERTLLFDLDMAIVKINQDVPDHPGVVASTCCYHNLLRRWANA